MANHYGESVEPWEADFVDHILERRGVPDGAIVDGFMTIVSFSHPDGSSKWCLYVDMDVPVSLSVGLLEMAKMEVVARTEGAVTNLSSPPDDNED